MRLSHRVKSHWWLLNQSSLIKDIFSVCTRLSATWGNILVCDLVVPGAASWMEGMTQLTLSSLLLLYCGKFFPQLNSIGWNWNDWNTAPVALVLETAFKMFWMLLGFCGPCTPWRMPLGEKCPLYCIGFFFPNCPPVLHVRELSGGVVQVCRVLYFLKEDSPYCYITAISLEDKRHFGVWVLKDGFGSE